jgi:UDP-N-acetylmuramate: L-alanyl-gamma-D-glutamyl-meso-diaminopimelate ligase
MPSKGKVHFIAIGGSAMHNLALALHKKGYHVSGSDDEINEPSKSRLAAAGILPSEEGWNENNINSDLDAVILGMHARADNPELQKAIASGIRIFSYPEYIYEQSKDKKRVVIGGSHGKTTITAMLLHVLKKRNVDFDYMVGAQLEGFDTMVKISDAPLIILEGDEYLSSPVDRRPKFHLYHADIALLSGIAWDHINVFPTFEQYIEQFRIFVDAIPATGVLIYCSDDNEVRKLSEATSVRARKVPYSLPQFEIKNGNTDIIYKSNSYPIQVFGNHNLLNLNGAMNVAYELGISNEEFLESISTFKGAARRLEKIAESNSVTIYKDFAHSPSKLKATTEAIKTQFPRRNIIACMELHTFSSLNETFLDQYAGSMDAADEAIVYFNPETIAHKKLKPLSIELVKSAFGREIKVFNDSALLQQYLKAKEYNHDVLLIMSSGNFDGININAFASQIANKKLVS